MKKSSYRSYKWITTSSDSGKEAGSRLQVQYEEVQEQVFQRPKVLRSPCNLISIFGRARQGKSFLMNCLAGEQDIFRISNEKESCTQGIDVSDKWLSLHAFSCIDGGRAVSGKAAEAMKVGFVDAEGQGDKDVSYDANLICPILLTSKCVIFNWKGDLQKDHILSTLGIMARAAQNVRTSSGGSSGSGSDRKKFGHLHIIFRDWQAVGSDEQSVYDALLRKERSEEAATRDQIRGDLLQCFQSIRVWLFDPPSEYTKDLRQKLTFEKTSETFRSQLRCLRSELSQQLQEPTRITNDGGNSSALTGKAFNPLLVQIVQALNNGEAVMPSSAYLNMMREEVLQLQRKYEAELREGMQEILRTLEEEVQEQPVAAAASGASLYCTKNQAIERFNAMLESVSCKLEVRLNDAFGSDDSEGGETTLCSTARAVLQETQQQVADINRNVQAHFEALYQQQLQHWLPLTRKRAEAYLSSRLRELLHDADAKAALAALQTTADLDSLLTNLFEDAVLKYFGSRSRYSDAVGSSAVDAVDILQRHFASAASEVRQEHAAMLQRQQLRADQQLADAKQCMREYLPTALADLERAHSSGFLLVHAENAMNSKYFELKTQLEESLGGLRQSLQAAAVNAFDQHCLQLSEEMLSLYQQRKDAALQQSIAAVDSALHDMKANMRERVLQSCSWREDAVDAFEALVPAAVDGAVRKIVSGIAGWMRHLRCSESDVAKMNADEKQYFAAVSVSEQAFIAATRGEVEKQLLAVRDAVLAELQEMPPPQSESEPEDEPEEDESVAAEGAADESLEDASALEITVSGKSKKGKLTPAEQQRRAREWACRTLGMQQVGGGSRSKLVADKSKKPQQASAAAAVHTKSKAQIARLGAAARTKKTPEQQRRDALEFAKLHFGEDIGFSPPRNKSARGSSSSSSSSSSSGRRSSADSANERLPFSAGAAAAASSSTSAAASAAGPEVTEPRSNKKRKLSAHVKSEHEASPIKEAHSSTEKENKSTDRRSEAVVTTNQRNSTSNSSSSGAVGKKMSVLEEARATVRREQEERAAATAAALLAQKAKKSSKGR